MQAARALSQQESARIVLSHLNGAAFVRKEAEDNPSTVLSHMPSLASLERIASGLGMQVVLPSFLGTEVEQIEKGLDDFYLVVLRWAGEENSSLSGSGAQE